MKILASRRFPGPAWDELGDVEYYERLDGERPEIDALVVVGEAVDDPVLDLFPRLSLVANYGVGYDAIDIEACRAHGVAVTNTPGVLDAATADLTMALILASRRRLVEGDAFVRAGRWGSDWVATELLGRIGRAVARRAHGFDMRLLYTKRERLPADEERELGLDYRDLDDLLGEADIVTIHVPLSPETEHLIDERRISLLRPGACFVNTARGAIVDEPALAKALGAGRIRAGLDVFAHEPDIPAELLGLPNVVLTPHVGSATHETRAAMTRVLVDNLLAAERGEPLPNRVT
jgi:glyoxylate reductase